MVIVELLVPPLSLVAPSVRRFTEPVKLSAISGTGISNSPKTVHNS
jgi:hypothetical protein